jgi:dihydrofolate reductase
MPRPAVSLVAAIARDGGIGHRGELLVRLPEDMQRFKAITVGHPVVIGGAELYALALPLADELQLTEIDAEFPADTFFPAWDRRRFVRTLHEPHETADGLRYAFVTYKKRPEGD